MEIKAYNNRSDIRCLRKQVSELATIDIRKQDSTSIYDFDFTMAKMDNWQSMNYFYIPEYNLWYYQVDCDIDLGREVRKSLKVDPLQSLQGYVSNIYTLIVRQEHLYSPYMVDPKLPTRINRVKETRKIGHLDIDQSGKCIALITSGGEES